MVRRSAVRSIVDGKRNGPLGDWDGWMIDDVTPEMVRNVGRAIRDPMIGGWPLIHW